MGSPIHALPCKERPLCEAIGDDALNEDAEAADSEAVEIVVENSDDTLLLENCLLFL